MEKSILRVKMFGSFSMHYDNREIVLDRNRASKSTQLLQILLLHQKDGIAKTRLIDELYGREKTENGNASLNNTIYRLKKQLRAAGLPEGNYIHIKNGMCRWESDICVEVDCCMFEEMILKGDDSVESVRMEAYMKGCSLYTGEFLPYMIGEDWAAVQNIHYQKLYFACLKKLCGWLKEQGRHNEICQLTETAAELYPFEEWQLWQIDSLIELGRYEEAMHIYRKTAKMFLEELNLPPSPEMLRRLHHMAERLQQPEGVLEDIKQRLREKERVQGAYYCTFPGFVDMYHVISRMMERMGLSAYIMLCTLKNDKDCNCRITEKEPEASAALVEAIGVSIRKGDFYTKYSSRQYLIMLISIREEDCSKVSRRIDKKFKECNRKNGFYVDYYVSSAVETYLEASAGTVQF